MNLEMGDCYRFVGSIGEKAFEDAKLANKYCNRGIILFLKNEFCQKKIPVSIYFNGVSL